MMKITNEERAVLAQLQTDYGKGTLISWNSLRLESATLGTQGQIAFNINESQNQIQQSITERRLNLVDQFTATRVGLFVFKIPSGEIRGGQRLRTYPNPQVFAGASEALNLMSIWNAELQILANSVVYFPYLRTENFYCVPQTPELLAMTASAGIVAGSTSAVARDSWPDSDVGKVQMIPTVTFSGGKNNTILIDLPESVNLAGTSSANYACLIFDGFLAQNANSKNINRRKKPAAA